MKYDNLIGELAEKLGINRKQVEEIEKKESCYGRHLDIKKLSNIRESIIIDKNGFKYLHRDGIWKITPFTNGDTDTDFIQTYKLLRDDRTGLSMIDIAKEILQTNNKIHKLMKEYERAKSYKRKKQIFRKIGSIYYRRNGNI